MTERRLLDEGATEFEATLLKSAINETPSAELGARLLAPLGAGTAGVGLGGAASGSLVKWVGAGAGALLLGGIIYFASTPRSHDSSMPREGLPADPHLAPVDPSPQLEDLPSLQMESPSEPSVEQKSSDTRTKATPTSPKAASVPDSLADEMRLLDRARSFLKLHKDPQSALTVLSEYEKKYPQGKLRPEATVLRVSALEASGSQQKATELKDEFLRAHPQSAHKKQLETREGQAP
jgi:hypothetical protein